MLSEKMDYEILNTVKRVLDIDGENDNTLWWEAIRAREKSAVCVVFKILNDGEDYIPGHQFRMPYCIFSTWKWRAVSDVKHDWLLGDTRTGPKRQPCSHLSVEFRESICNALTMTTLNDLKPASNTSTGQ